MPFAVFRRHQRKLLAIFAILAMFGFVLADTLPRLFNGGPGGPGGNPVIAELYEKPVYGEELGQMMAQRNRANRFMAELISLASGRPVPVASFFGDVSTRAIVDALILQHEADALEMPNDPQIARQWLEARTGGLINKELFEETLRRSGVGVGGQQILSDIANQIRLANVRQLLGEPVVTPLDVFQTYRDQVERISVRAVAFPVEEFVAKVPEPTDEQVRRYYEKYKDVTPDPTRETPGFKIPRQIRVEILSIDGAALTREFKDKLTEAELHTYYENRKSEFAQPTGDLPVDVFAGDPQATLTPPVILPFNEVRPYLASALAEEKAQAEIADRFSRIRDEVMIPFADEYLDAVQEIAEAKKEGEASTVALPKPSDLKAIAQREGMTHEISPLLTREQAEKFGQISTAEVGSMRLSGGRKFAEEFFDPKTPLFEPVELTDIGGLHFLARKREDLPPRVPPLDEIRPRVVLAWKSEQARELADKAARAFAERVKSRGGKIADASTEGRPVITTDLVSRLQPGFPIPSPGQMFQTGPPTASEIAQIPNAGEALRDALFNLDPGEVAVAANQPKTIYYVLTQEKREPASFATLYAPNGDYIRYQREAMTEAVRRRDDEWMNQLRAQAGLKPDWKPKEELDREASSNPG